MAAAGYQSDANPSATSHTMIYDDCIVMEGMNWQTSAVQIQQAPSGIFRRSGWRIPSLLSHTSRLSLATSRSPISFWRTSGRFVLGELHSCCAIIANRELCSISQQSACLTVASTLAPNSLHAYFLAPTNANKDIVFEVCAVRDGRSFCTRSVIARQGSSTIMLLMCSFHDASREATSKHYATAPKFVDPDSLPTDEERLRVIMSDKRLPVAYKGVLQEHLQHLGPIDVRHARDSDPIMPQSECPAQLVFFKPKLGRASVQAAAAFACRALPDEFLQRAIAAAPYVATAFASDHMILATAALPHTWPNPNISMMASLDHSIWFHSQPNCAAWNTFELQSPRLNAGRGYATGRVFSNNCDYCASVAQEGLLRFASPPEALTQQYFELHSMGEFDSEGQPVEVVPQGLTQPVKRQIVVHAGPVWDASETLIRPRRAAVASASLAKL